MLKLGKGIRSPGRDIYSVNFADYLPETLKRDPRMKALAAAVTEQMLGVSGEIDNVLIYSRIDELPEELIDILAFDMHVDWYDYSYPLAVKRDVLKNSVKVHKKMGTKYAVETALQSVYQNAMVSEWFEYGGRPYHFKIDVDISGCGLSADTGSKIMQKVYFYKNLRSHCDGIYYRLCMDSAQVRAGACSLAGGFLKVKAFRPGQVLSSCMAEFRTKLLAGGDVKIKARLSDSIRVREARTSVLSGTMIQDSMKAKPFMRGQLEAEPEIRMPSFQKMKNEMIIGRRKQDGS